MSPEMRKQPNVLFIAVDDMRDWTSFLGGYAGTVHTPNIERLVQRGVNFTNAHCPAPLCNPSRTAVMTGLRPSTTGIYDNGSWWRPNLPDAVTIPEHFMAGGYRVEGAGKIHHHTPGFNPPDCWHAVQDPIEDSRAWVFRPARPGQHREDLSLKYPQDAIPWPDGFPRNGIESVRTGSCSHPYSFDWGDIGKPDEETGDFATVAYAREFLKAPHSDPFFLGAGFVRPHLPWYAPAAYQELYPLDDIALPPRREPELGQVRAAGREIAAFRSEDWRLVQDEGKHREAIQGYLGAISFTDANVGRILQALDESVYADNTIVMLWSDHGFHLGEKDTWHKCSLWEQATRIPFVIAVPSAWDREDDGWRRAVRYEHAVSSIDIYPTLIDLCSLDSRPELEGTSLISLLYTSADDRAGNEPDRPSAKPHPPALTTWKRGNHAIRTDRFRYIRYENGEEELYDHHTDPNEWNNLALNASEASSQAESIRRIIEDHVQWLPVTDAPAAPIKNAFDFDWRRYTWTRRESACDTV